MDVLKRKKVCFVIPSLNVGGMERVLVEIANYANKNKSYEVSIIKLTLGNNFYTLDEEITIYQPDFVFNNKFRLFFSLKTFLYMLIQIKKIKPDSILSFGEMYNSFVLVGTFFHNKPVFVSDRSQPDRKWGFFHEKMRKLVYRRATGIIAQTSYSKDFLYKELGHKNIKVISNPGRNFKLEPSSAREKVIITVGRLIANKKTDLIVDIFDEINNKEWQLWIVGDGPEREKIENKVNNSHLKNSIKILGSQKNVEQLYQKAKIFAFASISEGFPNVLVEAQEFGLACISFDCVAGPSDIIEDEIDGFLIPLLDKNTYKLKLNKLMEDDQLLQKMSENAVNSSKKYNVEIIAEQYLNFITS